jgi:hypothetical protein
MDMTSFLPEGRDDRPSEEGTDDMEGVPLGMDDVDAPGSTAGAELCGLEAEEEAEAGALGKGMDGMAGVPLGMDGVEAPVPTAGAELCG